MKRWSYVLVPGIILLALIAWRISTKWKDAAEQAAMMSARAKAPPVVAVTPVVRRDIVHTFDGVGSVQSPFNVNIASKVTGRIEYLQLQEGDPVKVGQALVRIDPSEVEAQVRQKQAALAEAQYRLAQAEITENPTNVGVKTQVKQQQAGLASTQADYDQTVTNFAAQQAAAEAAVQDATGKVNSAKAGVGNAKASLANAQAHYDRTYTLYKQGFVAAQDVDDARTAVTVQQEQVKSAEAQLDSAAAQRTAAEKQASIVTTSGKANIAAAHARVVQADAALEYAKANIAQQPAYKQNIAALKASVSAAAADLRDSEAQLSDTVLTSPINGFVTARNMDPGAVATAGQAILTVQSLRQVWVSVPVPEHYSSKIFVGQVAQVNLDALPGRTFTGKVTQVNPSADPLSRQFSVIITLDNPQHLVRPGMFARVSIVTDRIPAAVVVPREAIQNSKGGPAVIVVGRDSVAHRRSVVLGTSDAANFAVLKGVQLGDKVIVLSAMPVKDGQKVRIEGGKVQGHSWQGAGA